jgi:hypothetical protein
MTDVTDGAASAEGATTARPGPVQGNQPVSTPATPGSPAQPVQGPERQGPQGELEKLRALTSRLQSERDQFESRTRHLETTQEEQRQNSQQQYMQSLSQMAPQERATLLEQEFQSALTPDPNQIRSEQKTQTLAELLGDARESFTTDEWNERAGRLRTGQLSASNLMREAYTRTVDAGRQAASISGSGAPQGPEVPDVGVAAPPAPPDTYTPEEIADIAATNPARYRELVDPGGKPKPGVTLTVEASQAAAVPISE